MSFLRKNVLLTLLLMGLLVIMAACGNSEEPNSAAEETDGGESGGEQNLIIGTHPTGSAYNSSSSGIASVLTNQSENLQVSLEPYEGTNAWIPLLNKGDTHLGLSSSPDLVWAINGEHGYREAHENLRTLVIGNYPPTNGLVVAEDSGINKTADLKGKKVAYGYAGNQVIQLIITQHLNSVGLTWDDVEQVPVSSTVDGLEALRDGRVDAAMGLSPVSAATIETDEAVGGLRVLNLADVSSEEFESFPEETATEISNAIPGAKPAVYKDIGILKGESAVIFEYPVMLSSSTHVSEDTAYEMVKTLFENSEELHSFYAWLESWSPETMFEETPPAPYHPGAVKYFKEEGIWTDEAEEHQQMLLEGLE